MAIRIAYGGALGRMGHANLRTALERKASGVEIAAGWERPGHPDKGRDLGELTGLGPLGLPLLDQAATALEKADVAVDFSTPAGALATLEALASRPLPLVLGTTGLGPAEDERLRAYALRAPVVHSSNFSIGVNILWKLVEQAARATGEDFDIEIVDVHHRMKKDAPSGTALTTAEHAARGRGRNLKDVALYGRAATREGERPRGQIGVHALRAGDVVGDHTVFFAGPHERLELTHRAHARENFARGALQAALWLAGEKKGQPGLYTMAEVLGL